MILLPSLRGEAYQVGLARPRTPGAGGVQPVAADESEARVGQVLQELGDEVRGAEDLAVGAEVGVIGRLVQDRGRMVLHNQLAERHRCSGDVLG
jgi:hypothetical protein